MFRENIFKSVERFQWRVAQLITSSKVSSYISQVRLLKLLPLSMFLQLNDVLSLTKMSNRVDICTEKTFDSIAEMFNFS